MRVKLSGCDSSKFNLSSACPLNLVLNSLKFECFIDTTFSIGAGETANKVKIGRFDFIMENYEQASALWASDNLE